MVERYRGRGDEHVVFLASAGRALARRRPAGSERSAEVPHLFGKRPVDGLADSLRRSPCLSARFNEVVAQRLLLVSRHAPAVSPVGLTIATEAVVVEKARSADIKWAADCFGTQVVAEGHEGKVLLRVPGDKGTGVVRAFDVSRRLSERGDVLAHPDFIRTVERVRLPASTEDEPYWAHEAIHLADAWEITRGDGEIRVAVLDEGVDARHPALASAIVLQRDFIGPKGEDANPTGDDAHGTACAGVIASRDEEHPGIAPGVSLVAARTLLSDAGARITDDFETSEAIDWCWRQGADVLSVSWGTRRPEAGTVVCALERARTQGREGKGTVIVAAAGNQEGPIAFPANVHGVLAVGASNQYDERKTRRSRDGEDWWGSNAGPELALLAPGVRIVSTDIVGEAGFERADYTRRFGGTSASAPHVAATAALILSVAPELRAEQVYALLTGTADKLPGQAGWTEELGHGRLNAGRAVANAR